MTIAAIVVTYRSAGSIGACLRSLLENGLEPEAITVWDNASPDGTIQASRAAVPGARITMSPANLGFAAAVNRAAAKIPDRDLLLLNPDATLAHGSMQVLSQALDLDDTLAVVGARLAAVDGSPQTDAWRLPGPGVTAMGCLIGFGRASSPRRTVLGEVELIERGFVPFTAVLLRRSTFDSLKGLDDAFWLYGEDADYCHRAIAEGGRIGVARSAFARHVGGSSSSAADRIATQTASGNLYRAKHFGWIGSTVGLVAMKSGAAARMVLRPGLRRLGLIGAGTWDEWAVIWRQPFR